MDWKSLGLFQYPRIIKRPMDLGTIKQKMAEGRYESVFDVAEDVRLIWKNCMKFNPEGTDYHILGSTLSERFEEKYARLCAKNGGSPAPTKTRGKKAKKEDDKKPASKKRSWRQPSIASREPRASDRAAKAKRGKYTEDIENDSDEEDYMNTDDEEMFDKRREKRIAREKKRTGESMEEGEDQGADNKDEEEVDENEVVPFYEIESPPPGHLSCLWYSREPFRHVFVAEKILGWKTRPVLKLETCETAVNKVEEDTTMNIEGDAPKPPSKAVVKGKRHFINFAEAMELKDKAIVEIGNDFRKRREVSLINPATCPYIKKIAVEKELARSKKEGCEPTFKAINSSKEEREEVFLIKWRGRSYLHCSWERRCDVEKYDQSVQQGAAKSKINRFLQAQAISLGHDWKKVKEDSRKAQAKPAMHAHHHHPPSPSRPGQVNDNQIKEVENDDNEEDEGDDDDYFSPLHLEVDRIIGCDENELDMGVLKRQRALNRRAEREALKKRELEDEEEEKWLKGEHGDDKVASELTVKKQATKKEEEVDKPWDPEDNVRYIVRWKGLQLTDATWEYWIDIKRDFVNEVEDFWRRQKPPSSKKMKEMIQEKHPHPRSFKKMKESPVFGISTAKRSVAKLEDDKEDDYDSSTNEEDEGSELTLRGYQLEGVNWLLWNWYNQRSCILADEVSRELSLMFLCPLHCARTYTNCTFAHRWVLERQFNRLVSSLVFRTYPRGVLEDHSSSLPHCHSLVNGNLKQESGLPI